MRRIAFALLVPLLLVVIAGLVVANLALQGASGAPCVGTVGQGLPWRAVTEAALMQLVFGVGLVLALGLLAVVMSRQAAAVGQRRRPIAETMAALGFLSISAGAATLASCPVAPYHPVASAFVRLGIAVSALAAGLVLAQYLRLLRS